MDVRLPNGHIIKGIPEGTPKAEIQEKAIRAGIANKEDFPAFNVTPTDYQAIREGREAEGPGINPIVGVLEQALHGGSFGLSDETQALIGAAVSGDADIPFSERYKVIRDDIRRKRQQFIEQEGAKAYIPEVVGAGLTGIGNIVRTGTLKGAAGVGAAEGAAGGFGYADEEAVVPGAETALKTAAGAAGGAILAPAGVAAGKMVAKGASKAVEAVKDAFPNVRGVPETIAAQLRNKGVPDDEFAKYIVKGDKAVKDKLYTKASSMEIPDDVVNTIKYASGPDKKAASEMLDVIEGGLKNKNFARANRPGDVAGRTLEKYIRYVDNVNKKARIELNQYAAKSLKGQPIDLTDPLNGFAAKLDEVGVSLRKTESGKLVPDFSQSTLTNKEDIAPITQVLKRITGIMERGRPDAETAHRMKRILDNSIPWGPNNKMSKDANDLLKGFRRGINETIKETYPEYGQINQKVKDTMEALEAIQKAGGSSYIPQSDSFGKQLGTLGRRLMGNQTSRIKLQDSIELIEDTARRYDFKLEDSSIKQAYFVDDLENLFGPSAQTSFRAEIGKGIKDVAFQGRRPTHAAGEAVGKAVEGLDAKTAEDKIKLLREMLNR